MIGLIRNLIGLPQYIFAPDVTSLDESKKMNRQYPSGGIQK